MPSGAPEGPLWGLGAPQGAPGQGFPGSHQVIAPFSLGQSTGARPITRGGGLCSQPFSGAGCHFRGRWTILVEFSAGGPNVAELQMKDDSLVLSPVAPGLASLAPRLLKPSREIPCPCFQTVSATTNGAVCYPETQICQAQPYHRLSSRGQAPHQRPVAITLPGRRRQDPC